jgi:uncharacterized alkaline shock family protein YloU
VTTPALTPTALGGDSESSSSAGTHIDGRGRTSLSDKVIEKTAAAAAAEVAHVHGVSKGLAAAVLRTDPAVGVRATIDGHLAQLQLDIEVDYPVSLRAVTRELRRHVSDRVRDLCEITVTDVDVHVTALRRQLHDQRRRVL